MSLTASNQPQTMEEGGKYFIALRVAWVCVAADVRIYGHVEETAAAFEVEKSRTNEKEEQKKKHK